jgi:hypothetical protein
MFILKMEYRPHNTVEIVSYFVCIKYVLNDRIIVDNVQCDSICRYVLFLHVSNIIFQHPAAL